MDSHVLFDRTQASLDEIKARVGHALARNPLCRGVAFDVMRTPRSSKGVNWTVSLQSVAADALWEASDIVTEIQQAYDLATAA